MKSSFTVKLTTISDDTVVDIIEWSLDSNHDKWKIGCQNGYLVGKSNSDYGDLETFLEKKKININRVKIIKEN